MFLKDCIPKTMHLHARCTQYILHGDVLSNYASYSNTSLLCIGSGLAREQEICDPSRVKLHGLPAWDGYLLFLSSQAHILSFPNAQCCVLMTLYLMIAPLVRSLNTNPLYSSNAGQCGNDCSPLSAIYVQVLPSNVLVYQWKHSLRLINGIKKLFNRHDF